MNNLLDHDSMPPWERSGWLEEVTAWICAELERQGTRITGAIEQPHIRPWSAVLCAPTTDGDVYFKATLPRLKHEVALTDALARWRLDCILPILASDVERSWLLMPDGGIRLRELIRTSRDFRHWEGVLLIYAEVQIEMADRIPELLALGVPDRRLAALPAQYERLLDDARTLRIDQEPGITSEEYRRLRELATEFAGLCEELAGYGMPETLNHGDFGDGNVFVQDRRPVFFDWGDCAISHPFYSLRTTFASLENSLDMPDGAPELDGLRDVYLEAWTRYGSLDRLRAAFKLALRLAAVNGALGWHSIVSRLEGSAREEYALRVPALLQEFLAGEA